MQASGPYLTIPQGGGDLYVPDFKEPADNARFHAGVARGANDFRNHARGLIDNGSDVLKVIASGAVLAFGGVPGAPEMSQDEIAAVVQVAHAVGPESGGPRARRRIHRDGDRGWRRYSRTCVLSR